MVVCNLCVFLSACVCACFYYASTCFIPSLGFAGGVMLAASYWSLLGILSRQIIIPIDADNTMCVTEK